MTTYYLTHPMHYRPMGFNGGRRVPVDVSSDDDAYVIRAAVPGLKPEEVEIQIHDDLVMLRGTPKADDEQDGRGYLLREMGSTHFERRLRLPEPVEAGKAEATIENGLLTLRLPIAETAKPKTIKVRAG
jgi:HSP20 family protein